MGEVLQEESGHPFGAAVNAAARVAGKARGGDVVLSETVRQLAGRMPGVAFRDRGRFQLKGFHERWRLYDAVAEDAAPAPKRRRRVPPSRAVAAGAIVAGVVAAAVGAALLARGGEGATADGARRAPPPTPVRAIDDSALILPGRSIGDARLGTSEAEVLDKYGKPELVRDWTAPGKVGSILNYTLHDDLFGVYLYDEKVVAITTQGDYYETGDGLRVGGSMPLPDDAGAGVTRNAERDFIWRDRYVYRDIGGGCNFWALRGFGAVTEFILPRHGVRRIAGIRIADAMLADEVPREAGLCR